MANEIRATYDTDETLYALIFDTEGEVWYIAGQDFENFDAVSIGGYDIVMIEHATASGQYRGTFDANIPAGVYSVVLYEQVGGSPVWGTDIKIGETATMYWDGDAEITNNMMDTVLDTIAGDMDATLTIGTGEIRATYNTGATLYVLMFNAAGQVWRNNAPQQFLAYAPGAIGVYDIPLSEIATNTGEYRADWPIHANMVEGIYSVVLFDQAGGSPVAADDARIGDTRVMVWDGSAEINDSTMEAILDTIAADVENIDGDPMRGTDGVSLVVPDVAGTAATLHGVTNGKVDAVQTTLDDGTSGLAKIASDVATLLLRLTAARAGYLDELAAANIPADIDSLLTRLSALRAGYLDELGPTNIPADVDTLLTRLTTLRAGYLDELAAANIPSDIDDILAKTNLITTGQILVSSPVAADGDVTIVQGDDYLAANGTALVFTSETWTSPDLDDATAKLRFITKEDYDAGVQAAALEVDADIIWAGSGNDAIFSVDLTAAQTTALSSPTPPNDKYSYIYQLQVTTDPGKKVTVALGSVYVKQELL